MSNGKMSDFVSFPLFGFTLPIRLRNCDFESHWNTLTLLDKKDKVSDLNVSHGKMCDFVLFPLSGLTLVIKLRNFNGESHWNTLNFLIKDWFQIWLFCQTVSDLV